MVLLFLCERTTHWPPHCHRAAKEVTRPAEWRASAGGPQLARPMRSGQARAYSMNVFMLSAVSLLDSPFLLPD